MELKMESSSLPVEGTPYVGGVDPVWDSVPGTPGSLSSFRMVIVDYNTSIAQIVNSKKKRIRRKMKKSFGKL